MRRLRRQGSPIGIWLAAVLCCASIGCTRRYEFNTALIGIPKAQQLLPTVKNIDIILIAPDGKAFPDQLLIRANSYAVVWVAAGKSLDLKFEDSAIPAPICEVHPPGVVCVAGPLNLAPGAYKYKGRLIDNEGIGHDIDPHVEIVK